MAFFSRQRQRKKTSGATEVASPVEAPASPAPSTSRHTSDPNIHTTIDEQLEAEIQRIGAEFLDIAHSKKSGVLSSQFWSDKLMNWSMQDQDFKVQLFRFVDCFPMLRTPEQVHDHLVDYLTQPGVTLPPGMGTGLKAGGVAKGLMTNTITKQITGMAQKFIAGTDAASALPRLRKLWNSGVAFSVDLLGEACVSEREAEDYQRKYLDLIENLPTEVSSWSGNERLERDHLGEIPRTNVSIKISSLFSMTDPINTEGSIEALVQRLGPVLEAAARNNVFINFDMEQFELKDLTLELFMACCEKYDFHAGLAMQAYLRSGPDDARRIVTWAKKTGRQVTVRLVKGAYWDYETIHAEEMGWPVPVWSRKADTDACFERMAEQFLEAMPRTNDEGGVKLALGSHNARSIAHSLAVLERLGLPKAALELQMLYGMGDQLKYAAVESGLRLREYVPVGEMLPGMAYLVRRLLENTSNESWLKAGFSDNVSTETLLKNPILQSHGEDPGRVALEKAAEKHELSVAVEGVGDGRPFFTEPYRDFAERDVRDTFAAAVNASSIPDVPIDATVEDAERSLTTAHRAFPSWRDTDPRVRAGVLIKAAAIMRRRRDELAGIMIRESGKVWREADADVCEAIDFLEYYAREAVPMFEYRRLGKFVGELDQIVHQPRGVAVVIAPWNFPLAILAGMTTAALVTGNTVIMKPAEQTPGIAKICYEILREAGAPDDVLHFLPGEGETVGAHLVNDPRTSLICFTGSMAVGLHIWKAASIMHPGQQHVKHVVCEMGGKNAVIVDASADLDEAVLGVRQSAFGFQGQKCSACSRAIVLDTNYDLFLERLVEATRALKVGNPLECSTDVGFVIDQEAHDKINSYIEIGKGESRTALAMDVPDASQLYPNRHYVAPHIFADVAPDARIATEEIFGPVLAVIKVRSFDEALEVANSTGYKLTGGVFSRKPAHLEQARREYRVGNLYLNRGCTGALVGRQPFGGFGLSGAGTKAGGDAYLHHFVEPRCITENTMRRGFAPEL